MLAPRVGELALLNLILAVLLGVVAGTAVFGVVAAAFAGATLPLFAAVATALLTTALVGARLRPARSAA